MLGHAHRNDPQIRRARPKGRGNRAGPAHPPAGAPPQRAGAAGRAGAGHGRHRSQDLAIPRDGRHLHAGEDDTGRDGHRRRRHRPGLHGHVRVLHRRRTGRRRSRPDDPPRRRARLHAHRHGRGLRPLRQRRARRARAEGDPRRGGARHEVRCAQPPRGRRPPLRRAPRERPTRRRGIPPAPGHGPHRPVLPAPPRSVDPRRGDRRSARGAGGRGEDPRLRPVRGRP